MSKTHEMEEIPFKVLMRVPKTGRPLIMRFRAGAFRIEFRRTDQAALRLTVMHDHWRFAYRDLAVLDYHEQRYRIARTIAARARCKVDYADTVIAMCYDEWYRASRESAQSYLLAGLETQPPQESLLEPLLPVGATTILVGDGGVGKSACALMLAQAWLAQVQTPLRARALGEHPSWHYFDWERISPSVFQYRCRMLARAFRALTSSATMYTLEQRGVFHQVDSNLLDFAEQFYLHVHTARPSLVIVDSLSAAVGGSLNDEKIARDVMNFFASIAQLGCAVLVIAHVAKEEARTKAKVGPFGSRMYYNLARQVLELSTDEQSPHIHCLHVTKNNYGQPIEKPFRYHLDWSAERVSFLE